MKNSVSCRDSEQLLGHTLITSTADYGILKSSEQLAAKQNQC